MRIKKVFVVDDEKTQIVSRMFNRVLLSVGVSHLDMLEFHIRDTNAVMLDEERGTIVVDYNHRFIQERDEKGIAALLLFLLFELLVRDRTTATLPNFILRLQANRLMIHEGFGDQLFYLYYAEMHAMQFQTKEDVLNSNLPWLSFTLSDEIAADQLKHLCLGSIQHSKAWDLLFYYAAKDLTHPRNVEDICHAYAEVMG
ncbi:MAG: hypothetical protein HY832_03555 [Candidatus Aenigmarchaeota archaeon]|nr:hypothetical protein [Candidatus Aenigmarchaeota archaeon]